MPALGPQSRARDFTEFSMSCSFENLYSFVLCVHLDSPEASLTLVHIARRASWQLQSRTSQTHRFSFYCWISSHIFWLRLCVTSTSCLNIKHLSRAAYLSGTLCPSSAFHIRFHTDAAFCSYPMRSSVCNYARLCPWSSLFVFCFLKSGVLYTLQSLPAHHGQLIVLVWSTFKWTLLVSAEELTQRERTVALREALAWKKFGAIWSNLIQMLQDHLERSGKIMNKLKDQWSPWGGFGSPREDSAGSEEPSRVVLVDLANTRHFAQAKEEGHLCCTQGTHGCFMDISWIFHGCFMMLHNVSCFLGVLQVAVSKFGRSCHVLSGPEAGVRLPMTPTPARAGARFSPYEPKESQETSGDFGFILWRKKRNEKGNIEFTMSYSLLRIHIEALLQSDSWSVQIVSIVSSFENFELFRPNPGACSSKPQVKRWSQIMGLQSQPVARRIIKYNKFIKFYHKI